MSGQEAAALCKGCGLCCDGSLFLAVECEQGGRLSHPCRFHKDGGCAVYAIRPQTCRAFTCRVLQAVEEGRRDIAWAKTQIASMRHLLAGLDAALPGQGGVYARAAAYLDDADRTGDDARLTARIAVYAEMIGDFRPLTDPPDLALRDM